MSSANVLGALSLVFWALVLVVVVKYLTFVLRADNDGEGGILALLALLTRPGGPLVKTGSALIPLALFGAALLYGDGIITPAISVLSAVEGLEIAAPALDPFVVPLTAVILLALFLVQHRGTARVGRIFGPVTLVWFGAIAATGLAGVLRHPEVLGAIDPRHAVAFFAANGTAGLLALSAVVLVVTGVEALYADLGHFGRRAIRVGWYSVAFPALLLNYFGQGALLVVEPTAARNPFFELVPAWGRIPMVALATAATIIASQAMISAAFSLTHQAIQLGYLPRMTIVHTSAEEPGQIYVPQVNRGLLVACIALVLGFRESTNLAAAYGMAVIGTMTITSILFFVVARRHWKWGLLAAGLVAVAFLAIDLSFLSANIVKILHGGWFPLVVAGGLFAIMSTWKEGRRRLADRLAGQSLPMDLFITEITGKPPMRVPGAAVFMTRPVEGVPPVVLHHLKHNKMLHETVVLLSILSRNVPHVAQTDRLALVPLGAGVFRATAHYGFMETARMPEIIEELGAHDLELKPMETTFFLGRETLLVGGRTGMARWRKSLFAFLSRNAQPATMFFAIPPNRVVELGAQVEL